MEHEEQGRDILGSHCQAFKREHDRDEEYKRGLIPKGRRTKRYKPSSSPIPQLNEFCYQPNDSPSMVLSSLSPGFDSFSAPSSPSSHESLCEHTEEEQEVASYLLLLSNCHDSPYHVSPINEAPPIQFVEAKSKSSSSKIIGPDGRTYYRCEDCGREFLSFQALGGHRASHKKSRSAQQKNNYDTKTNMLDIKEDVEGKKEDDDLLKLSMNSFSISMVKSRIHQCTICACEFTSGQALGGHMRRHRNPAMTSEATFSDMVAPDMDNEDNEEDETLKENQTSPLILDLNLPAPSEEKRATNPLFSSEADFQF